MIKKKLVSHSYYHGAEPVLISLRAELLVQKEVWANYELLGVVKR